MKIIENTLMLPELSSYQVEIKPTLLDARDWLDRQPRQHELSSSLGIRFR
jgi:hypothetical protein